jgi:hypothetical protein
MTARRPRSRTRTLRADAVGPAAASIVGPALLWYILNLASAVPV